MSRTRNLEAPPNGETTWLTQVQLAELFETGVPSINIHPKSIYEEAKLDEGATIKPYLIVRSEGSRSVSKQVLHYSLAAVVAVGFRVRSQSGTSSRQPVAEAAR